MARLVLLLFFCFSALACLPQNAKQTLIAPYIKTGAYSHQQSDVFSFTTNQAALGQTKTFSAGVFGERKFMLNELNLFSGAAALPTHSGNFGLQRPHVQHRAGGRCRAYSLRDFTHFWPNRHPPASLP